MAVDKYLDWKKDRKTYASVITGPADIVRRARDDIQRISDNYGLLVVYQRISGRKLLIQEVEE